MAQVQAHLEAMAGDYRQYPQKKLPEIALVGRSNVGKSSFINAILNRKKLAFTSSQPGKTRTVNFYNINDAMRLVDLPGYGYAKASAQEQEVWAERINEYLYERVALVDVLQIVDIRHKPSIQDQEMHEWILAAGFTGHVIANKADKLSRNKQDQQLALISKHLDLPPEARLLAFSSQDGRYQQKARKLAYSYMI